MNNEELIKEYLTRANVDSIDKLSDLDIAFLYTDIDPCPYAYSAYEERVKRSKKDAHELAELMRYCIKNGKRLNSGMCMREGSFDSLEMQKKVMSAYRYNCWL